MGLSKWIAAATSALSALLWVASADLWLWSARTSIPDIDQKTIGLSVNPAADFNAAMKLASRRNRWAAGCAAVAAVFQAFAVIAALPWQD
jgi:hypothetical protein